MDDTTRVLARLDRIGALDRGGAAPAQLLAELRGLLRDAGAPPVAPTAVGEEVVERPGTAQLRT